MGALNLVKILQEAPRVIDTGAKVFKTTATAEAATVGAGLLVVPMAFVPANRLIDSGYQRQLDQHGCINYIQSI